jgi:hypothetical protein
MFLRIELTRGIALTKISGKSGAMHQIMSALDAKE